MRKTASKKLMSLIVSILMTATLVAGCTTKSGTQTQQPQQTEQTGQQTPASATPIPETAKPENIVLTMEQQNTEKPERIAFFAEVAKKYNQLHPNVKIEITNSAFADANKTILTALSSGQPFDIFEPVGGAGDTPIWLQQNAILDLTPYFEANNGEWKQTFRDGVVDAITYGDGKIYNVPIYLDSTPLLYHKDIFDKLKLQPATTKDEFFTLMDTLKQAGYVPFQVHGSLKDDLLVVFSLQFAAKYGINPFDIVNKKVPFTDPWFKDALSLMKEMYTKGDLPKNFWTIGGTEGRLSYAQGKMAMRFGFFWDVDTQRDMGMPYANQGVAGFPNLTGSDVKLYKPVLAASFMVSSKTKHPDEAVDFLKFLTNAENQDDMAYKYFGSYPNGMPAVNKDVQLSDYAKAYMNDVASGIGTVFTPYNVSLKFEEVISTNLPLYMQDKMSLDDLAAAFDQLRS